MIELSLLLALSNKENLEHYKYLLNPDSLLKETIELLNSFAEYFNVYNDHITINWDVFLDFFFQNYKPFLDDRAVKVYKEIIIQLSKHDLNSKSIEEIIKGFKQQEFYVELRRMLDKNIPINQIHNKIEEFSDNNLKSLDVIFESMDLDKALEFISRKEGLRWRCKVLDDHFDNKGVIQGDFIVVAAYAGVGKTAFLCSEVSKMAEQIIDNKKILWFNTEGDWKRVLPRIQCASLNCTIQDLDIHREKAKEKYKEKMNGNSDRIQVINAQGFHIKTIERVVKKEQPALIVFDMLDAFRGFDRYNSSTDITERYERLYQWGLSISQIAPVLATSQTTRNGNIEDKNYINVPMTEMKGSGVAKQGAANVIIMISKLNSEPDKRFLSTPKFKVNGDEEWTAEVKFDKHKVRYI